MERKLTYDPLIELMALYDGRKATREKIDAATLPVEERLKQRIVDGDQLGVDADLDEALRSHDPLTIINTILLDGMKVVGELFGSGQMQLPFVLQSAETMKAAVRHLEPFMERTEQAARGTMVLATVKGDVHDIGKNLVDIILTNNGYRVINLGIKVPVEVMLDAVEQHNADAIGMSGLLVKSTLVMKENLELMHGRGIHVPVVLGGAALTRRYVEHDLREIYGPNVAYAEDAFSGLHYMELLAETGVLVPEPAQAEGAAAETASATQASESADSPEAARRRASDERGAVKYRTAIEEEIEELATLMLAEPEELQEWGLGNIIVAELRDTIVGCGRIIPISDSVAELTEITVLPEQWAAGVGMDLVRVMRRTARGGKPETVIYVACNPDDADLARFYRTLGFDQVSLDDPRAAVAEEKIAYCLEEYRAAPALFISKPASQINDRTAGALDTALHLMQGQVRDADFPLNVEQYEAQNNVRKLRVTSDVDRTLPLPEAPFWGSRVVENIHIDKVFEYINEVALIRGQWQVRKGKRTAEEYRRELDEVVYPKFEEMKLRAKRERLLDPKVIYGFFPCRADYNSLVVYRPAGVAEEQLLGEWNGAISSSQWLRNAQMEEWLRFEFPRQSHGRHLCITDFFRPIESGEYDVLGIQIVTVGGKATEYSNELFRTNNYSDYLYFHGLSVESAEALAEYWHRSMRTELGIAGDDAADIRRLFSQGYRGSRYSFGYPACPDLEQQTNIFQLLRPERIGLALSEEFMLEPEQSTSAIVVHHPAAKYFNVRE